MTEDKKFKRLVRQRAARSGLSYAAARKSLLRNPQEGEQVEEELVAVILDDVKTLTGGEHAGEQVVLLKEVGGRRQLGIVIGQPEAVAIAQVLRGAETARPMTHDAFSQTVDGLGARLERIIIRYDDESKVFLADAVLVAPGRSPFHLDCRPSDALALAVRQTVTPEILADTQLLVDYSANAGDA